MTKPNYKNVLNEDDLQWKTTSNIKNERQPQILKVKYLSNHWSDLTQILNIILCAQINYTNVSNEDALKWKTNSNIKGEISQQPQVGSCPNFKTQQPLVRSSPNFKLKLM